MLEGRFDESLVEMRRANDLDPLSAEYTNDMALVLLFRPQGLIPARGLKERI